MIKRVLSLTSLIVLTVVACHNVAGAPLVPDGLRLRALIAGGR